MTKLILDACCNHLGNRKIIKEMIEVADAKGADYIKFQLYDANKLNKSYPEHDRVHARLKDCGLSLLDLEFIFRVCDPLRIQPMFTIFDSEKVGMLVQMASNSDFALKIASPDMMNLNLIDTIVQAFPKKTLLISCGMHTEKEIDSIRRQYLKYANINWLYCVSRYPAIESDIDYDAIASYDGFSDHTMTNDALKNVILRYPELGYYEKHFTLSRNLPIVDRDWAVEPGEIQQIRDILDYSAKINNYKMRWVRE